MLLLASSADGPGAGPTLRNWPRTRVPISSKIALAHEGFASANLPPSGCSRRLDLAAARCVEPRNERHTVNQDLPALAVEAMVAGWDSDSLRVLAGERQSAFNAYNCGELLAKSLDELGWPQRTAEETRRELVGFLAWLYLTRRAAAHEVVQRMETIAWYEAPEVLEVSGFSGLDDELTGGWGRSRAEVEHDIRQLAKGYIATLPPAF